MKIVVIGGSGLIGSKLAGAKVGLRTLVPDKGARLGETRFETWLTQSACI